MYRFTDLPIYLSTDLLIYLPILLPPFQQTAYRMYLPRFSLSHFTLDARMLLVASAISAISFFGFQMLLQPLYLLRLGFDLSYLGLFSAVGSLTYMVMSLPSGALGSRFGDRNTIIVGGLCTVLGMALLPLVEFVPTPWRGFMPLLGQAFLSGGWALYGISMVPALMLVTTPENRNRAYALSGMLRGLGTFGGTIVGGLLPALFAFLLGSTVDDPAPYRYALWIGALLGFGGILPILRMTRPTRTIERVQQADDHVPFPIWPTVLLILHVYLGNSSVAVCQTFCSAYMDTDLRLSTAVIGLITGAGQFVGMFSPLVAPRLASRYGNGWTLMVTTAGSALSLLLMALGGNWIAVGVGRMGMLALSAMWMPALQVFQMEMVATRWRSLAYGILSMGMSLTFTSVSFGGGYMAERWGYQSIFLLGVGLSLVGSLLMLGMRRSPQLLAEPVSPAG